MVTVDIDKLKPGEAKVIHFTASSDEIILVMTSGGLELFPLLKNVGT